MASKKTYTNAELTALVEEFSAEFDALVKAEVQNNEQLRKSEKHTGPNPLVKDDDGGSDKKDSDKGSDSDAGGSDGGSDGPPPGDSAPASPPPGGDASAGGAPPPPSADPAASAPSSAASPAAGGDPLQALTAAYAQLPPEEIELHLQALTAVLQARPGMGGAPGAGAPPPADPMASAASASAAPPPPPGGPGAVAPLAGENSKPLDPAATMALKSAQEELSLVKKERDAAMAKVDGLEKSVAELTDTMSKAFSTPVRKSVTGKDLLVKSENTTVDVESLSKSEVTKKLLAKAYDPKLEKKDRDLINNYYKGSVKVDAIAHLLA